MADTFQLDLVTPEGSLFSGQVQEVVAPGVEGEFGVLPGHASMLAGLTSGRLLYRGGSGEKALVAAGGFAEVTAEKVTVLLDDAAFVDDLDAGRLDAEIADMEASPLETGDDGYEEWRKKLEWKQKCREMAKG